MTVHNLFHSIPADLPEERIDVLAEGSGAVRIERIVSRGHASPPGDWYDQETTEWVMLLRGSARLRFENKGGEDETRDLLPGDWVDIPAHARHRVEATSSTEDTVWLAVHWG